MPLLINPVLVTLVLAAADMDPRLVPLIFLEYILQPKGAKIYLEM